MYQIILASGSPRRRELLDLAGIKYTVKPSQKEEVISSTIPEEVVKELSFQKADDIAAGVPAGTVVIGSDTVVALEDQILGKPKSKEDACRMLKELQGKSHKVYTGVTFIMEEETGRKVVTFAEATRVDMYPMTDAEIERYVEGGEPMDKAGAYAIQGEGTVFIRGIEGDYNTVVGLPLARVYQELKKLGVLCEA